MKRLFSGLLIAVVAVTFCMTDFVPVQAAAISNGKAFHVKEKKTKLFYKEGEALVLFKKNSGSAKKAAGKAVGTEPDVTVAETWNFNAPKNSPSGVKGKAAGKSSVSQDLHIALVKSKTLDTRSLIKLLKSKKNVQTAEPNYIVKAAAVNDTFFDYQWGLDNNGQNGGVKGKSANISTKWDKGIKGSEKVVAIVDTGIDYEHEDLQGNIWENTYQPDLQGEHGFDFVNNDDDPMDDGNHGTHCAGIIGAKGNNGAGISGVNQNIKLMGLKFLDADGSGVASGAVNAYHYINKALEVGVPIVAINNSWGGGEPSEIFEKLIELVGQKGAVSVFAAGNESNDNDEYCDFPSGIDSPYKVSVAAVNEKNELAGFSNYGKTTVDLAAPGADILSTVSGECYNPTIYDSAKQKEISRHFNDFEGSNTWGIPEASTLDSADGNKGMTCQTSITSGEYFGKETSGKSLKVSINGVKRGDFVAVRIPYTIGKNLEADQFPRLSVMAKILGPEKYSGECAFSLMDVPAGTPVQQLEDYLMSGSYIAGKDNFWTHLECMAGEWEEKPESNREMVFLIAYADAGDYEIYLDDIGISRDSVKPESFGKYDFYNGTSMATPFVTGAVALAAAEAPKEGAEERIGRVFAYVEKEAGLQDKVSTGGALDFSKFAAVAPRISSVHVDTAKKQLILRGSGLDAPDLNVKVNNKEAKILSKTKTKAIVKDEDWINRQVDITIAGGGKTVTKEDVYLVKGKTPYTAEQNLSLPEEAKILATNGKELYFADSETDIVQAAVPGKKASVFQPVCQVEAEKLFKKSSNGDLADYDFTFGKDLVYSDGMLYNVAAYSQISSSDESAGGDFGWIIIGDDWESGPTSAAYSSQFKLLAFDAKTGKTIDLGGLPSDMKRIADWTLASYNGKLYLMGGYDFAKKEVSRKVKIFDPASKKWSAGPSLPEGRAAGRAVQSGNCLVYTLGYGAGQTGIAEDKQNCPVNLILEGNTWKTSSREITPYEAKATVKRSGTIYQVFDGSVGICKGGMFYAGIPTDGLGDTFRYDIKKDSFSAEKYSKINDLYAGHSFTGIPVGGVLYGCDENGDNYRVAISSGLVKVQSPKVKGGMIQGANTDVMPGTKVILKAKPDWGYGLRTFTVNGKKVKGTTKTIRLVSTQKAAVSFKKLVSAIKLNEKNITLQAGKSFKLKVKVSPVNAADKRVIYTSGNKRYAAVNSKGVITAKKAGIGKTVKITAKAKDGSGKKAVCKVKIIK